MISSFVIRSMFMIQAASSSRKKTSKISAQYASLSDEEILKYSNINVGVNDSGTGIHDKTLTLPFAESSMAKEKVRNKRKINGNIRVSRNPNRSPTRERPMF